MHIAVSSFVEDHYVAPVDEYGCLFGLVVEVDASTWSISNTAVSNNRSLIRNLFVKGPVVHRVQNINKGLGLGMQT